MQRSATRDELAAVDRRREWQEQRCPRALKYQARVYEALKVVADEPGRAQLNNLALYLGNRVEKGFELDPYMADECEETLRRITEVIVK